MQLKILSELDQRKLESREMNAQVGAQNNQSKSARVLGLLQQLSTTARSINDTIRLSAYDCALIVEYINALPGERALMRDLPAPAPTQPEPAAAQRRDLIVAMAKYIASIT